VIQAIALSTGNFAKIDQNNNLKFIFKTPTDIIINDYVELEDKRDTRPITIVTLGMSQVEGENVTLRWEQGITLYGENYLIINDNPFTNTQEKRQQQIQAIFDKIKGFSYSSFSTKSAFIPQGQCGDLIKFKNKAGTLIESIILRYSSDYDDVLLEAPSIIKASVNYQNEPSLELQIKNTQIIVDKQAQTISMQIKNINDLKDDLNNNYSTKNETTNLITQTIKYTENVITETGGSNILINPKFYQNAEGWEKSENCIFEVITDNTEVEQNTNCKTEMILKSGRLSQRYTQIIGEKYTIAFKYKKPAENINKCSVKLFRNDIDYLEILNSNLQKVNREDISIGYIASVNNPKIIIEADNTEFKINDLIIQPGISTQFSNNTNELRGTSYKITKENYTHYNLATKEKGEYDSNDVKYYNQEGNIVAEYGLSESIVNKGTFNTELNLGNLKCLVISNDDIIIY
ncbi:MAG: hypothetical protein RR294_05985, partial [Bacilli bacterium]